MKGTNVRMNGKKRPRKMASHGLDLARSHNPRPKEVPNHEVALVAQDGSDPSHAEKRKDVEPAALRKEPGRKQQRVTR